MTKIKKTKGGRPILGTDRKPSGKQNNLSREKVTKV